MAGEIKIKADLKGTRQALQRMQKLGKDVKAVKRNAVMAGGEVIRSEANRNAPGPYIEMTASTKGSRAKVEIGPDEEHWHYLFFETGASEHGIKPRKKSLLLFSADGQEVFARATEHPGMVAQPYLRPALDAKASQAVKAVGDEIKRAIL